VSAIPREPEKACLQPTTRVDAVATTLAFTAILALILVFIVLFKPRITHSGLLRELVINAKFMWLWFFAPLCFLIVYSTLLDLSPRVNYAHLVYQDKLIALDNYRELPNIDFLAVYGVSSSILYTILFTYRREIGEEKLRDTLPYHRWGRYVININALFTNVSPLINCFYTTFIRANSTHSYLDKYLDGSWRPGEILVSYRHGRFYVYITFHRDVVLREPRAVMGVDLNFNNITYTIIDLNGDLVSIGVVPFRGLSRALHYRKLAEKLQRRYPKNWRFLKWARRARARRLSKARNILIDTAHYVSKRLVEVAREYNAVIVFEDLEKLRENNNGGKRFSWMKPLWCYRRIQEYTEYKALIEGIKIIYMNPAKTSRRAPR
jgi:IS605 OrfB family transposase